MSPPGFDPRPVTRAFWEQVGEPEPFPRQLRHAIVKALPVAIIILPRLTLSAAANWLEQRGASCFVPHPDRAVRGFLVARGGHGFIFIDGSMASDEERLTLSHEAAHFLHHYHFPRARAFEILGDQVKPALDGDRPPTAAERLSGVMRGAPMGMLAHLIERSDDGFPGTATLRIEVEADLIGFELLAPSDRVVASTSPGRCCRDALIRTYGLPPVAAAAWAGWIDARRGSDSLISRLRDHPKKNRS
jgi:hypothetical protein